MRFTIISMKSGHQPPQSSCDFYAPGGTIGRGVDNNLVLPDNDRTISRLQAIVHVNTQGKCRVTNCGCVTRVMLNNILLERGRQVELQDGDILGIDDYRIEVTDQIQNTKPVSLMATCMQQQSPAAEPKSVSVSNRVNAEPTVVQSEIWHSLTQEFSISDNILSNRIKQQPATFYDPFSQPAALECNTADPLAMFNGRDSKLEHKIVDPAMLFSDEALFKKESILGDVTPSILMRPDGNTSLLQQKEVVDELDPLALFGDSASAPFTCNDDPLGLMGGGSLTYPGEIIADKLVITQEEETLAESSLFVPEPQVVVCSNVQSPKGLLRIDPLQNIASPSATSRESEKGDVLQGELLAALLEGMGLSEMQPVPQFSRENMRQLGHILSMFSQGTVALFSSRSILKRGVKADMTMVLDDANNPFKLLPTGKAVLIQMFGTPMPGFMPPTQSVRDALIDLQAHQLGMISGIRAIIAAMLQSFNPKQLEEQAKLNGVTSRLALPGSRKAVLWDYFVHSYDLIASDLEDGFHPVFSEAFLRAYEIEVNQYKDSQRGATET